MSKPTYTPLAYSLLRKCGYTYDLVERSNSRVTTDFCGFADIIAFRSISFMDLQRNRDLLLHEDLYRGSLAIQVCRYTDLAEHLRKLATDSISTCLIEWLRCCNRFEVWSFPTPRDKRVKGKHYQPKFRRFLLDPSPSENHFVLHETELSHFLPEINAETVQK